MNGSIDSTQGAGPAPGARRLADLLPRVLSSAVLIAVSGSSVWIGGEAFAIAWLAAAAAVCYEWQMLIGAERPYARIALAAPTLVIAAKFASKGGPLTACAVIAIGGALAALVAGAGRRGWAFAGIAYAGAFILSVTILYGSPTYGTRAMVWLFAVVWGTDVFAYFGGRLIGGPKVWPKVSPSKTWAGTIIGISAGALLGAAIGASGLGKPLLALPIFALGLATAIVSQGGDVLESSVKRRFGAKDSSHLIPGHGGFMDRLDGFIAAATFAALFGVLRGHASIAAGLFEWF
ncbi:phosphatidate cytidylyltransferase [Methylocapsa acidiphila]|uniref:phosphatidate cytidylyltransferase n=1 Tax=Methylocapsa acidiphila TaxID=133552 RepID=UPI00041DAA0C|nr:phosphatidate cytidylyltransferase [Methylocapsa acidiphila]